MLSKVDASNGLRQVEQEKKNADRVTGGAHEAWHREDLRDSCEDLQDSSKLSMFLLLDVSLYVTIPKQYYQRQSPRSFYIALVRVNLININYH